MNSTPFNWTSLIAQITDDSFGILPDVTFLIMEEEHGTARYAAIGIFLAVFDAQCALGKLGGHAEETGHDHPESGARSTDGNGHRHVRDVAHADGAGDGGRESLEMGDFARFTGLVLLASHDTKGAVEAAYIDEAKVDGEKSGPCDQPDHDQRQFRVAHGNGVEDHLRGQVGHGLKCLIDGLVDAQWSPRPAFWNHRNLAKNARKLMREWIGSRAQSKPARTPKQG